MVKILDTILSQSAYSAEIDIPLEKIDIADWLFNLPEAEYLRCCPPDHIAAGVTGLTTAVECRSMSSRSAQA